MKTVFLLLSATLLFNRCQKEEMVKQNAGALNQEFEIALHDKVQLKGNDETNALGSIEFIHLDESRCPANAMCIRQGAAITSFRIARASTAEPQTIRMFVGDFMPNDPRNKRNLSADTVAIQLNNTAYQLILKQVVPYPGTSEDTPKATLVLKTKE